MSVLITLLVYALILGLLYWLITLVPLPPPFKTVALAVLVIIGVVLLIDLLTGGALGVPRWTA